MKEVQKADNAPVNNAPVNTDLLTHNLDTLLERAELPTRNDLKRFLLGALNRFSAGETPKENGTLGLTFLNELVLSRADIRPASVRTSRSELLDLPTAAIDALSNAQQKSFKKVVDKVTERLGLTDSGNQSAVAHALFDEILLLRDQSSDPSIKLKRPNLSIILKNLEGANAIKIWESFNEILKEFTAHPEVALTATTLVMFAGIYRSGSEAAENYHCAKIESDSKFGTDPESKDVAFTAALLVFTKKYTNIDEAHKTYSAIKLASATKFGTDPESKDVALTAALLVFTKKYTSIDEAHEAYSANRSFGRNSSFRLLKKAEV